MKTDSHILPSKSWQLLNSVSLHGLAFAVLFLGLVLLIFCWYNNRIQKLDQQLKAIPDVKTKIYISQ